MASHCRNPKADEILDDLGWSVCDECNDWFPKDEITAMECITATTIGVHYYCEECVPEEESGESDSE